MSTSLDFAQLVSVLPRHLPYPPVFVTVSGAHLYGFSSPDSDVDLRGAYLLPLRDLIGLHAPAETVTRTFDQDSREIDLVAHDLGKFLRLLLNKNGYVLEQLYSPLVVKGGPALDELRALAQGCITRHVYHHYAGFARHQIKLLEKESPPQAKTLLYVYRVLLTGTWLLRTGRVQVYRPDREWLLAVRNGLLRYEELLSLAAEYEGQLNALYQNSSLPELPDQAAAEALVETLHWQFLHEQRSDIPPHPNPARSKSYALGGRR